MKRYTRHRSRGSPGRSAGAKAGCFSQAALEFSPFLGRLNQNPVLTNITACMHHVRTAHHSDTLSVSAQAGDLSSEVRICRIDRPHNLPRKIHYHFQSSATHLANHSPLAIAWERICIFMNHGGSLCLRATDGNPSPACMCRGSRSFDLRRLRQMMTSIGSTEHMREALTSRAAVVLYCRIFSAH